MEKVEWQVEGMDCTNCALTITRYLRKEGLDEVKVNFIGGDVSFEINGNKSKESIAKGIENLGYHVVNQLPSQTGTSGWETSNLKPLTRIFSSHLHRFLFCLSP